MTCGEIHAYLGTDPYATINLAHDSAELSEHISKCPECNRFIEEQNELAKRLHFVRTCVPAIPASLDVAVLARYRTFISARSRSAASVSLASRIRLHGAFRRAAAVALVAVVAYGALSLFNTGQRGGVRRRFAERRPVLAPHPAASADRLMAAVQEPVRKKPTIAVSFKHASPVTSVAQPDKSFPTRFQSLMYCDQLSCPGAMDVIRVQLSAPVFGLSSVSSKADDFISADVLVGPDGIARGIRLVE
jgi:hypothetical protein